MVLLVYRIVWTLTLPLPHDVNVLWRGGEAVGVPAVRRPEVDGHHHRVGAGTFATLESRSVS
jgi:hypothetical protein